MLPLLLLCHLALTGDVQVVLLRVLTGVLPVLARWLGPRWGALGRGLGLVLPVWVENGNLLLEPGDLGRLAIKLDHEVLHHLFLFFVEVRSFPPLPRCVEQWSG